MSFSTLARSTLRPLLSRSTLVASPAVRAWTRHAATAAVSMEDKYQTHKYPRIVSTASVVGSSMNPSLDLSHATIGQVIEVPYETTIGGSETIMWMSTFQTHDRLYTSTPYAQAINLSSHVLPFYFVLFKAISMGHVDEEREVLDIGFEHGTYVRPAFAGDTLRQQFTIKHLKLTSNGENTILTVGCELFNQRNQLVFSCDKNMLFPNYKLASNRIMAAPKTPPTQPRSQLLSHILYNAEALPPARNIALLTEGELCLHSVSRPIGKSMNMALSTLNRWTHPQIYNVKRFKDEQILVPGGLILAGAIAASSRGLFECLHETMNSCIFLHKVSPVDLISSISYIHSIRPLKEGIEEVELTTLGLKNIDVTRDLAGIPIPKELFTMDLHRRQLEALCADKVPILSEKIVVKINRTIVRQSPFAQQSAIPLL